MESGTGSTLSDALRSAGTLNGSAGSLGRRRLDLEDRIVLRVLSQDGSFQRSVKSVPGRITYLQIDQSPELERIRRALLGEPDAARVNMRCGERELYPSEVHVAERAEYLWSKRTVGDVLNSAGVPESLSSILLGRIGLQDKRDSDPNELGAKALKRLAVACSFFVKARVLFFDRPFAGIEDQWVESLGELMLEGTRLGQRVVIVAGEGKMPPAWRANRCVFVDNANSEPKKGNIGKESSLNQLRELHQDNPDNIGPASFFITRPQLIQRPRVFPETFKSELISNPHFEQVASERRDHDQNVQNGNGSSRRSPSGKLTRVTLRHRMKASPAAAFYHRLTKQLARIFQPDLSLRATPVEGRLREYRRAVELRLFLFLLLLLIAGLLFV